MRSQPIPDISYAIFATGADAGGLVRFVNRRRSEMTPAARQTFDELDPLRRDFRFDGTEPGEQGDGSFGMRRTP